MYIAGDYMSVVIQKRFVLPLISGVLCAVALPPFNLEALVRHGKGVL